MRDFYEKLAQHQITEKWVFQEVLKELHTWRDRFCIEFKLEIPECAIAIEWMPQRRLGHFRPGHNGFGLKGEIAFSQRHVMENLAPEKWWKVLGTLLHELLHGWQQIHGKPGKGNYHNIVFRKKAYTLGLIIDERGVTQYEQESLFIAFLKKHDITIPTIGPIHTVEKHPASKSKLRLWMCGCPVRARVAVHNFNAQCLSCNQVFELQR